MPNYTDSLISLAFLLFSFALCIKSLFSKRFYLWICPLILTLSLVFIQVMTILPQVVTTPLDIPVFLNVNEDFLNIFNTLFCIMIIIFKIAISKQNPVQRSRRSKKEYEYLNKANRKTINYDEY